MRALVCGVLLLLLVAGFGVPAMAGSIALTNPSFETLPAGGLTTIWSGGNYETGVVSGSYVSNPGHIGQWQPNTGAGGVIGSVPDGVTVAFAGGPTPGGNYLAQDTLTTIQSGATYTLQVDVGWRTDELWNAPDIALETCTGSYSGCTILAEQLATTPTQGGWSTDTLVWNATTDAGDELYVYLINNGPPAGASGEQADFDDVLLGINNASVPEPATMALIGIGLCGIAALTRRVRR